jgi:hypothetical protein
MRPIVRPAQAPAICATNDTEGTELVNGSLSYLENIANPTSHEAIEETRNEREIKAEIST